MFVVNYDDSASIPGLKLAIVFGSMASGKQTLESDLELAALYDALNDLFISQLKD